jgi:membrane protease subunit HflC
MSKLNIFIVLIVGGLITLKSTLFIVNEGNQAIVTQFGKPIGRSITEAGLYAKVPFTQEVRFVDKRILNWDGFPNQIPTKDKKYIKVDTTARWRIVDALKFIQTVQNEAGAKARLDTILDGHTRDIISGHNLVETVRYSNDIIDLIQKKKQEIKDIKAKGSFVIEEEISGDIEKILIGREQLSQMIVKKADDELGSLGIELIDVQLRQISYEKSVETKVYERMISERQRIAQKIRSIGKGEKAKIEGRLSRDLNRIESEAYKKAQIIRGKAEAKATNIYARSLSRDPKFYEFMKSMDAYKDAIKGDSKMLLSTDSDFLKYLR